MSQRSLIPDLVPHQPMPSGRVIRPTGVLARIARAFPGSTIESDEKSSTVEVGSNESRDIEPIDAASTKSAGGCEHPVQLSGTIRHVDGNGEIVSTEDAHTYASCKTRRATRCEPCATLYQHDARHIIGSGLKGGKGTTIDVVTRPALFVTLTAPGFGEVHTARGGTCLPRRDPKICEHGKAFVCWHQHEKDDPTNGQPICPDCYCYEDAVLWNNAAPALWRVTRVNIDRMLARLLQTRIFRATGHKIPRATLAKNFTTSYVKVTETQRRGMVHFHITIRVDGNKDGRPAPFTVNEITQVIETVVRNARAKRPDGESISWGDQLDIDTLPIDSPDDDDEQDVPKARPKTRRQVTNYLAKYSTKGSDIDGKLDKRFKNAEELTYLNVNNHLARMVRTSWRLARKFPDAKLDTWAHQLGYRGHFLTKSRTWSTTFKALRQARKDHQQARRQASWDATRPESMIQRITDWHFTGTGYRSGNDSALAEAMRNNKQRRSRRAA